MYHSNDGHDYTVTRNVTLGQRYTIENCPWTRSNYDFTSWGIAPGYGGIFPGSVITIDSNYAFYANWKTNVSPIILDLDGNGVRTTSLENGTMFDFSGDGQPVKTAWADPNCGFLVRDINGNGQIDNASEMFGNFTLLKNGQRANNGFDALAEFDLNGDGVIDRSEAEKAGILIWNDANLNGKVDPGELLTLEQANILSIQTQYTVSHYTDENGNIWRWQGVFNRSNGSRAICVDVLFATE